MIYKSIEMSFEGVLEAIQVSTTTNQSREIELNS